MISLKKEKSDVTKYLKEVFITVVNLNLPVEIDIIIKNE